MVVHRAIKGCEERGAAMVITFVHGLSPSRPNRAACLYPIQRLDEELFGDPEDKRVGGRCHVAANNVLELGRVSRIVRGAEGSDPVGLSSTRPSDSLNHTRNSGHDAGGSTSCFAWRLAESQCHDARRSCLRYRRSSELSRRVAEQVVDTDCNGPPLPVPSSRPVDLALPPGHAYIHAFYGPKDDPDVQQTLLAGTAIGDDRVQANLIKCVPLSLAKLVDSRKNPKSTRHDYRIRRFSHQRTYPSASVADPNTSLRRSAPDNQGVSKYRCSANTARSGLTSSFDATPSHYYRAQTNRAPPDAHFKI